MIYLVPNADCVCFNNNLKLFKGVKYQLPQQNVLLTFFAENCVPLTINLYEICRNFVNGGFLEANCHEYYKSDNANLKRTERILSHYNDNNKDNLEERQTNRYNYSNNDENNSGLNETQNVNRYNYGNIETGDLELNKTQELEGKSGFEHLYNYGNNDKEILEINKTQKKSNRYNNGNNDGLGGANKIGLLENCKFACCCGGDVFVFLNFVPICNAAFHTIKFKGNQIDISLSQNLTLSLGGEKLIERQNCNLTYSHFETFNDFCFIYFLGARNFVAVFKGSELFYADYYDKIEFLNGEYYFLTRLNDSLNHGRVCHVSARESEKYLAYLDEFDLNLKPEFLPHAFLDCSLAGNFKYCNALLCDGLKQHEPSEIANFFCEFDWFYPLDDLTFALIKKDAVAGIYKFEIENNEIVNISELS